MATAPLPVQTIATRVSEVLLELGNRADLATGSPSRVALWLRNAYINLCQAYDFEGLEATVDLQASGTSTLLWPVQARALKSLVITDSSGSVTYPDFKDITTVRRMQSASSPGLPSTYTLYAKNLIFAPAFDTQVYDVTIDYWQRPMFTADVVSTPLLLPDDWFEALDYLAEMRGHTALGEIDKAVAIQKLMYGYTDPNTGTHIPGLLFNLQLRRQANSPSRDYGLQPRSARQKYV